MVFKVKCFIKTRWKVFSFERKTEEDNFDKSNFGFNSAKTPKNEHFIAFEKDLYNMMRNIEFKNIKSPFQAKLSKDAVEIKQSTLPIPADKTNNLNCPRNMIINY